VYDFKTHVSVGYTALEIRYLRESRGHGHGAAYEIYRVTEQGGLELRGVLDERLAAREAMCFLRRDTNAARRDYDDLRQWADRIPAPCAAELHLALVSSFDPPNTTALLYPAAAGHGLADWLNRAAFRGGDHVIGGTDVHAAFMSAQVRRIESHQLPTAIDYTDRSSEEVLRTFQQPLQR
jgi:hypothetical protein